MNRKEITLLITFHVRDPRSFGHPAPSFGLKLRPVLRLIIILAFSEAQGGDINAKLDPRLRRVHVWPPLRNTALCELAVTDTGTSTKRLLWGICFKDVWIAGPAGRCPQW
jgi:hypothetical protein